MARLLTQHVSVNASFGHTWLAPLTAVDRLDTVGPSRRYFRMVPWRYLVRVPSSTSWLLVAPFKWPHEWTRATAANLVSCHRTTAILSSWSMSMSVLVALLTICTRTVTQYYFTQFKASVSKNLVLYG